ncbi:MAG TPA: cytochrome c3 family protein [Longimicrobiales bacterium]|nr:cytochrome c3 family protein [Longimicrobiales bacterium]
MGRALLILCAGALLACAPDGEPVRLAGADTAPAHDAHADIACAACHTGALLGSRRAAVPRESCTTAGCHEEGGPPQVSTKTATFHHQDHARDGAVALSCAGCHTHARGREPLIVSVDGCALCHLNDLNGGKPDACRLCHQTPQHVALTSQALPVPHSALPWIETGCVRCHYDVAQPQTRVALARCTSCHSADSTFVGRGIATDLHPVHTSVGCGSCHEGDAHRVRAMSSAVQLVCTDCHDRGHDLALATAWRESSTCGDCHTTVHQAQQRLLLGLVGDAPAAPSAKFIAGITCRSCHIRTARSTAAVAGTAIRGQAEACAGCHRTEYRQVLDWWLDGTRARTRAVAAYIAAADTELRAAGDSARALLGSARAMTAVIEQAGGQHNLELSDRVLRESVHRVRGAYAVAGRVPPAPPALGSPAHEGVCSFCHYSSRETWDFNRLYGPFHRSVMGVDR